uniref:Uncharacterized protein n=1 Tax=Tanacetum cinerariifolium TaxID=118510 RepID=A0A699KR97_TANCI|nr:hypothetical protein [Tanacetum cinerariifolium]
MKQPQARHHKGAAVVKPSQTEHHLRCEGGVMEMMVDRCDEMVMLMGGWWCRYGDDGDVATVAAAIGQQVRRRAAVGVDGEMVVAMGW